MPLNQRLEQCELIFKEEASFYYVLIGVAKNKSLSSEAIRISSTSQSADISSCRIPKCSVNIISLRFLKSVFCYCLILNYHNLSRGQIQQTPFWSLSFHFYLNLNTFYPNLYTSVCILKQDICYHVALLFKSLQQIPAASNIKVTKALHYLQQVYHSSLTCHPCSGISTNQPPSPCQAGIHSPHSPYLLSLKP